MLSETASYIIMVDEIAVDVHQSVVVTDSRLDCAQQKNTTKSKKRRLECFQFCEVMLLTPVMLVMVGLFSIPTVLYALSEAEVRS